MNYINPTNNYTFFNIYYMNMSTNGLINNLNFFDEKCICTINGQEYIGAYYAMLHLLQNNIHRIVYRTINNTCQQIANGYHMNTFGICQFIDFHNNIINEVYFSESHIMSNIYPYMITNYIAYYG